MTPIAGPILTAAEMRLAEDEAIASGTDVDALMQRAGSAVARAVKRFVGDRTVLILCGPGNNGGDGYVAAQLLHAQGVNVRVAAFSEAKTPAAMAARRGWIGPLEDFRAAHCAPVLVDALFGTGLARPLDAEARATLGRLRDAADFVVAVDLPSGVGTDDGADLGAVSASLTLALGALKPAHLLYPARSLCGSIMVVDIGVPAQSRANTLPRPLFDPPVAQSHKYRRGMAAVCAGEMPGAATLASVAAMRTCGYVVHVGNASGGPNAGVARQWEDVADDRRIGALLIGPGLGRSDTATDWLDRALATDHALVLDADALFFLGEKRRARIRARTQPVILTPHSGEFDALFSASGGSKIDRARAAATALGATIIFKGPDTVIAGEDGQIMVSSTAPSWLASAGTGDVLAGIVTGLLASGMEPIKAAGAGVWLHGQAARFAGPALIADELEAHIPAAIAMCL